MWTRKNTYENVLNEPIWCESRIVVAKSQGGDEAEVSSPEWEMDDASWNLKQGSLLFPKIEFFINLVEPETPKINYKPNMWEKFHLQVVGLSVSANDV